MFGWHVHEKFVMVVLAFLTLTATASASDRRVWQLLTAAGSASLLPLLDPAPPLDQLAGTALVATLSLLSFVAVRVAAARPHAPPPRCAWDTLIDLYSFGALAALPLVRLAVHAALGERFPFLSLLVTSLYCAGGTAAAFLHMLVAAR